VYGGQDAKKRTWPWQVNLQKDNRHWCGGVLIDNMHVLTVAHRVQQDNGGVSARTNDPSRYKVVLGLHNTFKLNKGTPMTVQSITIHPNFRGFSNNIAILKLASPVQFQSKINAACLPEREAQPGAECFVTGWGERGNNEDLSASNVLQQAKVPIVASSTCRQPSFWGDRIDDTMLCAGGQGADACNGDGGGPLVCKRSDETWELHGLVAWGARECGVTNKPGVYTNIFAMKNWILANIGSGASSAPASPAAPTSFQGRNGATRASPRDSSEENA
jgi:secreted trypsin-like serine protease